MSHLSQWKRRARQLKREVQALGLAAQDPRTPWYARALALIVLAYALSPLDLIPDFIPVLGYLDDLLLIPLGIALTLRLIPAQVMEESRRSVVEQQRPLLGWIGAGFIVLMWVLVAWSVWRLARLW